MLEQERVDEQLARIQGYVKQLNEAAASDETLLCLVVSEVYDRVTLYLNNMTVDSRLERIIARICSGIFSQTANSVSSTDPDVAVSSMSDNGQSISYANEVKNYLSTTEDNELFAGFAKLLAPYRRIDVVS